MKIAKKLAGISALAMMMSMTSMLPTFAAEKPDVIHSAEEVPAVLNKISGVRVEMDDMNHDVLRTQLSAYTVDQPTNAPEKPEPERFDLRDVDGKNYVTPVKLQNPYGTCWAFSATAAAETSIAYQLRLDQNTMSDEEKTFLDFSERHLAWFTAHPLPEDTKLFPAQAGEGMVCSKAEKIRAQEGYSKKDYNEVFFNSGGFMASGTSLYSSYQGPVYELTVPYHNEENEFSAYYIYGDFAEKPAEVLNLSFSSFKKYSTYYERYYHSEEEIRDGMTSEGVVRTDGTIKSVNYENLDWWEGPGKYLLYNGDLLPSSDGTWDVSEDYRFDADFVLDQSNMLPSPCTRAEDGSYQFDERGLNAIKNELLNGRAVSIAFIADQSHPGDVIGDESYMNFIDKNGKTAANDEDAAYWCHYSFDRTYNPDDPDSINKELTISANHAVTIVGYDDTIPKEYFNDPKGVIGGDGAFIVKNSWGTGWGSGGTGYFYLSYYDQSICQAESFSFRMNKAEDVKDKPYAAFANQMHDLMPAYCYDELVFDQEASMANVFTADKNLLIQSVGYTAISCNEEVAFDIYLLDENSENPTDGEPVSHVTETYPYSGFHRTNLDTPVAVKKGQTYAVVATAKREDGNYGAGMKYAFNDEGNDYIIANFRKKADDAEKKLSQVTDETPLETVRALEQTVDKYQKIVNLQESAPCGQSVVNKGESLLFVDGKWTDLTDLLAASAETEFGKFVVFDNFGIKAFAECEPINVVNAVTEPQESYKAGDKVPCKVTVNSVLDLSSLKNVEILLDGELLKTIGQLDPGAEEEIAYTHTITKEEEEQGTFSTEVTAFAQIGNYRVQLDLMKDFSETTLAVPFTVSDFASPEKFAEMSKIDYEKKYGVAVTPETTVNEDGTVTVTLKDAEGELLDTYTLNAKTGIGKNTSGAEINLPQTGNTDPATAATAAGAAAAAVLGAYLMLRSAARNKNSLK